MEEIKEIIEERKNRINDSDSDNSEEDDFEVVVLYEKIKMLEKNYKELQKHIKLHDIKGIEIRINKLIDEQHLILSNYFAIRNENDGMSLMVIVLLMMSMLNLLFTCYIYVNI